MSVQQFCWHSSSNVHFIHAMLVRRGLTLAFTKGQDRSVYWTCATLIWLWVGLVLPCRWSSCILCFGCGKDITSQTANRCNILNLLTPRLYKIGLEISSGTFWGIECWCRYRHANDYHDYPKKMFSDLIATRGLITRMTDSNPSVLRLSKINGKHS